MNEDVIYKKKKLIDKYFNCKKYKLLFDVLMINIDTVTMYLRLDYNSKSDTYHLSLVNISAMINNKVDSWVNTNLVHPTKIDGIKDIILNNLDYKKYVDNDDIDSKIIINSYFNNVLNTFEFKRYIPKEYEFLADVLYTLFDYLPRYLYPLFQIMVEKLINPKVNSVFAFDLEKDDYNSLFDPERVIKGLEYYKDNRIRFIETINNWTYADVKGRENYLVTILNNKKDKEVEFSCTCPDNTFCKHIYAVLTALKDNKEKKFYKITYLDSNKDIIDNIKNFTYYLCVDLVDDYFVIVKDKEFQLLPILDNNKLNFKIIEDDDDNTLENKLKNYLKRKGIGK